MDTKHEAEKRILATKVGDPVRNEDMQAVLHEHSQEGKYQVDDMIVLEHAADIREDGMPNENAVLIQCTQNGWKRAPWPLSITPTRTSYLTLSS